MTDWLESEWVDAANGVATLAAAGASLKIRFHTADPTETGAANEVSGAGYPTGGVAITFSDISGFVITSATIASITNVPAATITNFSIWDTTTNTWFYGPYSQTWTLGRTLEFVGTEVTITIGGTTTEFGAQKISDALRNVGSYINTTPRALLFTAAPPTDGTVGANEAADGGYARGTLAFAAESGGAISTNADEDFGAWVGAETITYSAMVDENETPDKIVYYNRIIGVDEATNGTFTGDTDWTKGSGWTLPGTVADCDGTQGADSDLTQSLTTVNETEDYEVTFTVLNYTAGNVTPIVGNTEGTDVNADGTYTEYITAGAGDELWGFRADVNFDGQLDNVSVKKAHSIMAASEKLRFESGNWTHTAT
jgi:hypothetical protein